MTRIVGSLRGWYSRYVAPITARLVEVLGSQQGFEIIREQADEAETLPPTQSSVVTYSLSGRHDEETESSKLENLTRLAVVDGKSIRSDQDHVLLRVRAKSCFCSPNPEAVTVATFYVRTNVFHKRVMFLLTSNNGIIRADKHDRA